MQRAARSQDPKTKSTTEVTYLTRQQFREGTIARSHGRCVFCGDTNDIVAHHIMERRLFPVTTGGYALDNGAAVCKPHHWLCETTEISVEDVRKACGITNVVLPPHLYQDAVYTKWGDQILANGTRTKGELFFDESVQKVLAKGGVLDLYTDYVKFPRTWHLPWSQNMSEDDRMLDSMEAFKGQRVIVTVKMDGENTTGYANGYLHARSVDGRSDPSRDWVKNFWSQIAHELPAGYRVCAENLFEQHSIAYHDLESFFLGFHVWNDRNECLSWDDTVEWFALLGIPPVTVIYDGVYDEEVITKLLMTQDWDTVEGGVMRLAESFHYGEYRTKVGKFVRKNHLMTVPHNRLRRQMQQNTLAPR